MKFEDQLNIKESSYSYLILVSLKGNLLGHEGKHNAKSECIYVMYWPFCAGCDCVVFADCVHELVVIACNCLYVCVRMLCVWS